MNFNDKTNKFIEKNVNVKAKLSELSSVLSKLSFTDSDIATVIDKICNQGKVKVFYEIVDMLNDLYFKDKVFEPNHKNAVKRIILDTIDLYEEDAENISKEIKKVLILAKKKGISPYKIAIKTNIRIATVEKFEQTLEALTKEKYNLKSNEKTELFSEEESNIILEQCASIACRVNAENLKNIINLLKTLSFDKETKSYIFSVKDLLKQVPSLMGVSAERIEASIIFLGMICDVQGKDSKNDLLLNIKENPSILLINADKIDNIGTVSENILFSLTNKIDKSLNKSKFMKSFNYVKLQKFIYNFDNLNSLNRTDDKTLKLKAEILEKFLGTKNAINCFLNNHIFLSDINNLKFVLSYLAKVDRKHKNNDLKKAFVENPSKFLKSFLYDYDKEENGKQKSQSLNKENKSKAVKSLNFCYNDFPVLDENYVEKIVKDYQSSAKEKYDLFFNSVTELRRKEKEEKAKISIEKKNLKKEKKLVANNIIKEESQEEMVTKIENTQKNKEEQKDSKFKFFTTVNKEDNEEKEFKLPITNYDKEKLQAYKSPLKDNKQFSFYEIMSELIRTINSLFDNLYKKQKRLLEKEGYLKKCYIGKSSIKTILHKIEVLQELEKSLSENSLKSLSLVCDLLKNKENYIYLIFGYKFAKQKNWTIIRDKLDSCLSDAIEIEEIYKKTTGLITEIDLNLWNELKSILKETEISRNILFKKFVFFEFLKIIENLYDYFSEDIIKQVLGFTKDELVNFLCDNKTNCQFLEDLQTASSKMILPYKYSMKSPYLASLKILESTLFDQNKREHLKFSPKDYIYLTQGFQGFANQNYHIIPADIMLENFDSCVLTLQKIRQFLNDTKYLVPTPYYDKNGLMYVFVDESGDIYSKNGVLCFSKNDDRYIVPNENSKYIEIPKKNIIVVNEFGEGKNYKNQDGEDEKRD